MNIKEIFQSADSKIDGTNGSGFTRYKNHYLHIATYASPFFNCQNFSIANFENLLCQNATDEEIYQLVLHIRQERLMVMLDVRTNHAARIKNIFKDCTFIVDQPYISTNNSHMHLFYIKLKL